jgi:hypothetical protein
MNLRHMHLLPNKTHHRQLRRKNNGELRSHQFLVFRMSVDMRILKKELFWLILSKRN